MNTEQFYNTVKKFYQNTYMEGIIILSFYSILIENFYKKKIKLKCF